MSVFALLSGQPFEKNVTDILTQAQEDISDILGDKCHYFVKPTISVEYCVFKWLDGPWKASWHEKNQKYYQNSRKIGLARNQWITN